MVGIVIGAALCYPTIQGSALQTAFETTAGAGAAAPYNLFGLPPIIHLWGSLGSVRTIQVVSYQSSSLLLLRHKFKSV